MDFLPLIGTVAGGLFGGGDSTSTQVQKADPWEGVQPALRELYSSGLRNFQGAGPQYYPSSTVAPQSDVTQLAQQGVYGLATQPSPVLGAGQQQAYNTLGNEYLYSNPATQDLYNLAGRDYLQSSPAMWDLYTTGSGQMLNANPYLDDMFGRASSAVGRQFSNNVMPGIASMFSGAGRFGSNQMAEGLGQAQQQYGDVLNNLATDIYGGNYARERGLQQQALGQLGQFGLAGQGLQQQALGQLGDIFGRERINQMSMVGQAPELNQADYFGMGALSNLGAAQDVYNQSIIGADVNRYNFGQQQPNTELAFLSQLLQGYPSGQTSSSTQPGSPLTGALGGFNIGQGLLNTFGTPSNNTTGWPTGSGFGTGAGYGMQDYGQFF